MKGYVSINSENFINMLNNIILNKSTSVLNEKFEAISGLTHGEWDLSLNDQEKLPEYGDISFEAYNLETIEKVKEAVISASTQCKNAHFTMGFCTDGTVEGCETFRIFGGEVLGHFDKTNRKPCQLRATYHDIFGGYETAEDFGQLLEEASPDAREMFEKFFEEGGEW